MLHIPAEVVQASSGVLFQPKTKSQNGLVASTKSSSGLPNQVLDCNSTGYIANWEISLVVLIWHHNLQDKNINVDIVIKDITNYVTLNYEAETHTESEVK